MGVKKKASTKVGRLMKHGLAFPSPRYLSSTSLHTKAVKWCKDSHIVREKVQFSMGLTIGGPSKDFSMTVAADVTFYLVLAKLMALFI